MISTPPQLALARHRSSPPWIACNLRLPSNAFLPDLALQQERIAVY